MDYTVTITNKKEAIITGCNKIIGFDSKHFDLETELGDLKILGENLSMDDFNLEAKKLFISGDIFKVNYGEIKKENKNFVQKLFK